MTQILMPKATAVWLIENTALITRLIRRKRKAARARAIHRSHADKTGLMRLLGLCAIILKSRTRKFPNLSGQQNRLLMPLESAHIGK